MTSKSPETAPIDAALAKSAQRVSDALTRLAMIEQTRNPVHPAGSAYTPDMPPEFAIPITLTWTGPAEQAAGVITNQIGWSFQVIGNRPQTPIIVAFDAKGIAAVDVLRDIGLQITKSSAALVLDGASRSVEFRYQGR